MPRPPRPFSFIKWNECFRTGYDRFCQELWDGSGYVDDLYPPDTPSARFPWADEPALFGIGVGGDEYHRPGVVSVWLLQCSDAVPYFNTEDVEDACEWEPSDAPMFWDDLGFICYPSKHNLATSAEPLPIAALLESVAPSREGYCYAGISYLNMFAENIREACQSKSIHEAVGLYCVFDYEYCGQPVFGRFCSGLVEYLGSYSYIRND